MTQHTRITPENVTDYPVGSELEFHFGAYYPTAEGRVTGFEILPVGKWNDEPTARLLAEYIDPSTGETVETTVGMLSTVGVGTYLLSVAEKETSKKKSPWAA